MIFLLTSWQPDRVNEPPFTINDALILFWRTVRDFMKGMVERLPYLLVGVFVFILFWIAGRLLQRVITNLTKRTHGIDDMLANLASRIINTFITIFGVLAACVVIFPSFKPGDIIAGRLCFRPVWHINNANALFLGRIASGKRIKG
ncbi:hypothetical protein [Spirosoma telluris]|uniref:hypothetical protein n=1 Tax=Spirosoma telluris TaxID=2183553 RepID=UPI002FC2EF04